MQCDAEAKVLFTKMATRKAHERKAPEMPGEKCNNDRLALASFCSMIKATMDVSDAS